MTSKEAVGVFICCEDSVILSRRITTYQGNKVPYGGYWAPFAGLVEAGESLTQAAVRELKEETGLSVKESDLDYMNKFESENRQFTVFVLNVESFPAIELCEEHTDTGYFRIDAIDQLPSDYKTDKELVTSLQKYKKK